MKSAVIGGLIALAVSFLVVQFFAPNGQIQSQAEESVYEHVMRTGTIRCGYQIYPPFSIKDENTGALSGIYPDLFEQLGREAELDIVWAEELGSDTMFTALENGRVDALCTPLTSTPQRAKHVAFTEPFFYVPFSVFVRYSNNSLQNEADLNHPDVSFIAKDGDLTKILAEQNFPQAQVKTLPGLVDAAQMYLEVATGKVDAIIGEPVYASIYMANNPGKIKPLSAVPPVMVIPGSVAVPNDDLQLYHFINQSLIDLGDAGTINKIIRQYVPDPSLLLLPPEPVQFPAR